jgi:hypothetical protein
MVKVHMTGAEAARDFHAVLARMREGAEVVIEEGCRPAAVVRMPAPAGRMISEVIADLKARGSNAAMEDDFARDVGEWLKADREPWNPPSWD